MLIGSLLPLKFVSRFLKSVFNFASFWEQNSDRIESANTTDNSSSPDLIPHIKDQSFAVLLGNDLETGTHQISVTITEEGDPWVNTRSYDWTLVVVESLE